MKSYLYRYDSKISPRPPIFTRGPVRVKSASIEKIFAPCYFSPRKPPRYGFSAGFLKIEILVILVLYHVFIPFIADSVIIHLVFREFTKHSFPVSRIRLGHIGSYIHDSSSDLWSQMSKKYPKIAFEAETSFFWLVSPI